MTTFDSSRYDIPTLITKLQDQRFDGYDPESLAQEIEKFRDGDGTASMGDAVQALKAVAGMLASTDDTLRRQLAELGVTWQSKAGGQASAVLSEQAGFSSDANTKVAQAAQLIFEQGEAFSRTKNKLPDPELLRKGDGGFTIADSLFSLFGFETDHAGGVKAAFEAKAQAVDALNAYAHDSGGYLASSEAVAEPQTMELLSAPGTGVLPDVGSTGPIPSIPDTSPTVAAGSKDVPVAAKSEPSYRAPAAMMPDTPTPPIGIPGPQTGSGSPATTPQQTTPSAAPPATSAPSGSGGGAVIGHKPSGGQPGETAARPGVTPGGGTAPVSPGAQVGGVVSGGQRSSGGGAWGKAVPPGSEGVPGGRGAAPGAPETALGKGRMVGSAPQGPTASNNVGPGFNTVRGAAGVPGLAEAGPAIGAAGAGGAAGGESERKGRGFGRSAGQGGKPVQELQIGDLPEEEEAQRANRATPQNPTREETRAILEPAATQDGDSDAEHVRRFGVDDKDLFTDQRMVSPDLIGDKAIPDQP